MATATASTTPACRPATGTPNYPDASYFIKSMRRLGYDNLAAIKDIVDNSLDAHATDVWITVQKQNEHSIVIADNGSGMDVVTLDEALRLGGGAVRDETSELGLYHMGLKTASLSICKRVEVITKCAGGALLQSVQDVDEIVEANDFIKYLGEADADATSLYNSLLGKSESGTIIRLTKCDLLQYTYPNPFAKQLTKELGRTYRKFLNTTVRMFVNDESVLPVDPLMLHSGGELYADLYSDEDYTFTIEDENGRQHTGTVQVKIALLPDYGREGNEQRGINLTNQGIYLMRNNREISSGEWLGVIGKHNDLNRVRSEVSFPASLDAAIGVDFTKQRPKPNQAFTDKLRQIILPSVKSLRKRVTSGRERAADSGVSHEEAARLIGQKANLLIKPKALIEDRMPASQDTQGQPPKGGKKTRENFSKTQEKRLPAQCRFETVSMSSAGPIWDADQEGRTVVIKWNVDHPFYQRFVLENQDNPSMVTATDFLVYSMAAAELAFIDDDSMQLMENIRSAVSNNMRTLLG